MHDWLAALELGETATALVRAIVRTGTYVDALDQLSADAGVAQLQMALGPGVRYVDGGWQHLVDGLAGVARAAGVHLVDHLPVREVRHDAGGYRVVADGAELIARSVVLAVGSPAATARLLPVEPGWGPLGPDATAACLDLGLAGEIDPPVVLGLGEPVYLSRHSPPAALAPSGTEVVHVLRYGATRPDADRAQLEGPDGPGRRPARPGAPAAVPAPHDGGPRAAHTGHRRAGGRPGVAVADLPGVFVAGDWVGPTGLLADAGAASAEACAAAVVAHLRGAPAPVGATLAP